MPTYGSGTIRDGVGAISIGRGGTNLAFADNGQVMLDNPSGLANMRGHAFCELGLDFLFTELTYSDPENRRVGDIDNPFPVGQLSFAKRLDDRWAVGFGAFSHAGFAARYVRNGPTPGPLAGPQDQKSIGALMRILPTVAYRVNDRLSIGGTFGAAMSHVELEGPYFLQGPSFVGVPIRLDVQGTGAAVSWSLGLQYDLSDRTTLGASYLGESRFGLRGSTKAELGPALGVYDSKLNVKWPRSLGIGMKHELAPWQRFAVDVIWYDWSSAYDSFDLFLSKGTGPVAGVTGPALLDRFPLKWRDTVDIRLGYEVDVDCCRTIRTGYIYHRNPIPSSTLTPYLPTTMQHAASIGYGRRFKHITVDFAYQYAWGDIETVGTSGLVGGDFDNSRVTTDVHWLSISFQKNR